jgi:hypothetical protein
LGCNKDLKVHDNDAGKRLKCPGCKKLVNVPGERPGSAPDAASPKNYRPAAWAVPGSGARWLWVAVGVTFCVLVGVYVVYKVREPSVPDTDAPVPIEFPEPLSEVKRVPNPESEKKFKPRPGGQATAPLLSNLAVQWVGTDPLVIRFAVDVDAVKGTVPFEQRSGLWFRFGRAGTGPTLRSALEEQLTNENRSLTVRGPGFVAAACTNCEQSTAELWTGTAAIGRANIRDGRIEISAAGSTTYPMTEVPVSWVYFDRAGRLSNEVSAIVDLKAERVIRLEEPKP